MLSSPREYKCSLWITSLLPKELSYPSGGKPGAHKICLKQCSPSLWLDCKSILWLQRGSWYYTTVTFSTTTPAKCWESVMLRRMTKLTPMALQFIDLHIPKTFAFIPATQSPGYCNEHFQYFKEEIPHFKKKNLFVSLSHFLFLLMMLFNLIELASPWSPPYHPIVLAPCWWHLPSVPVSVVHRSIIPPPIAPPGWSIQLPTTSAPTPGLLCYAGENYTLVSTDTMTNLSARLFLLLNLFFPHLFLVCSLLYFPLFSSSPNLSQLSPSFSADDCQLTAFGISFLVLSFKDSEVHAS